MIPFSLKEIGRRRMYFVVVVYYKYFITIVHIHATIAINNFFPLTYGTSILFSSTAVGGFLEIDFY